MKSAIEASAMFEKVPRLVRVPLELSYKYFPEYACDLFEYQTVQQAPEKVRHKLLTLQLHAYLRFTVFLELGPVTEACTLLCMKELLPWLPAEMKEEAFKIYTEELEHAYMYHDVALEIERATGVAPLRGYPTSLVRFNQIVRQADPDLINWVRLFFVIISETLITKQLSKIPQDKSLQPIVRRLVQEHAYDEARHHAFFKKVFELTWWHLLPEIRLRIGVLLPDLICAYLGPDGLTMLKMLQCFPEVFPEPQNLLSEVSKLEATRVRIATAASPTIQMFRSNVVFSDARVTEAFYKAGLISNNQE